MPSGQRLTQTKNAIALAALTFALEPALVEAKETPLIIQLQVLPAGVFMPSDGRTMDSPPWNIDTKSAEAVIARFNAVNSVQQLVIDYEHQTLNKEKNGQPAPAAAWFKSLYWTRTGLMAEVELTARARAAIDAKEYRYFSPVFSYDRTTGTVTSIEMGALTNTPGIHGMQPLAAIAAATAAFLSHDQETPVNPLLKALLAALGLPETTPEPDAIAALTSLGPLQPLQARANVATAVCTALQLPADATPEVATAACASLRSVTPAAPDPAKYVPIEAVQQLQTQVAALTAHQQANQVDALIQPALADGRLLPAMETWARDLGKKDVAALTAYLTAAQPIAALTSTQTGGKAPLATAAGNQQLSAEELAVCSAMGLTPEAYRKANTAVATGATA